MKREAETFNDTANHAMLMVITLCSCYLLLQTILGLLRVDSAGSVPRRCDIGLKRACW